MTKQQIPAVIREIETLREHATAEEKARLDYIAFDPNNGRTCIYGQMTGHCNSERANELMGLSTYESLLRDDDLCEHLSPLEVYICDHPKWNWHILQYIKGEINELPDLAQIVSE